MNLTNLIVNFFMAELNYILRKSYSKYFDTLKNTSYDKENDSYMCHSSMKVLNFDDLTKNNYPKKQPSSFDALLYDEDEKRAYCVEFKNQDKAKINNIEIQNKLIDGRETLDNILREGNVAKSNYTFIFCVVFKANKKHYKYRNKIELKSIYFSLEKYTNKFDKIITNDIDFFTNKFIKKYNCET